MLQTLMSLKMMLSSLNKTLRFQLKIKKFSLRILMNLMTMLLWLNMKHKFQKKMTKFWKKLKEFIISFLERAIIKTNTTTRKV